MITLVWRTDVHLADRAPQSRTDDWAKAILDKIVQVGEIARNEHAQGVLDGGDFFHVKSPSRTSHQLVNRAARAHQGYPCPVWATIGNHDCKYGSSEFLEEGPLGVLFETGVFRRLYGPYEAVFEEPGLKVRVVGIPYHGTQYDINRFTSIAKRDEDFLMVVAHCLANEKGGTLFEGEDIVKYSDLANLDPDCWMFGHWHKDQGIREIASGKWVINTGSLSRGSISQDDVNRDPKCISLHFSPSGFKFKVHPIKTRPATEIFDLASRDRKIARTETLDIFVEHLKDSLGFRAEDVPLEDALRAVQDVPDEIKERAISYVERTKGI